MNYLKLLALAGNIGSLLARAKFLTPSKNADAISAVIDETADKVDASTYVKQVVRQSGYDILIVITKQPDEPKKAKKKPEATTEETE